MEEIIFATNNGHKLSEIQQIIGDRFRIIGLSEFGITEEIPETGTTLEENASLKSNYIYQRHKVDCFADDTGLMIDALDGRPGVYSARYAGENGNAEKNIEKVLDELHGVKNRAARFITVISLIYKGQEFLFEGKVEGRIIENKKGLIGFGYDPVFIPDGYQETFAEMPAEIKNKISHRANATKKLVDFLLNQ